MHVDVVPPRLERLDGVRDETAMELDRGSPAVRGYGTQAIGTTSLGDKLKEQLDKSSEPS